ETEGPKDSAAWRSMATLPDEVGQLARSFQHMTEKVAARENSLKQAQEAVRRREQYFQSLTENISDVIVLLDQGGLVTYVSSSLTRLLAVPKEDVLGQVFVDRLHADDRNAFAAEFRRVCADPQTS